MLTARLSPGTLEEEHEVIEEVMEVGFTVFRCFSVPHLLDLRGSNVASRCQAFGSRKFRV